MAAESIVRLVSHVCFMHGALVVHTDTKNAPKDLVSAAAATITLEVMDKEEVAGHDLVCALLGNAEFQEVARETEVGDIASFAAAAVGVYMEVQEKLQSSVQAAVESLDYLTAIA